jgi:hypothetical protein
MNFIVYKTTNLINGKYYIGVHGGEKDSYYGSGRLIKRAIRKYGKENFIREVLLECETEDIAFEYESIFVKTYSQDKNSYNLEPGGRGNINLGKTVVDRGIGIHAATFEERSGWSKTTQSNRDPFERLEMSSMGGKRCAELGKAGFQTCSHEQRILNSTKAKRTKIENDSYSPFKDPEVQRRNGVKGGATHKGCRTYNDGDREYKFKSSNVTDKELTDKEFGLFLSNNRKYFEGKIYTKHPMRQGIKTYNDGNKEYKFKSSNVANKELTLEEFSKFINDNQSFKSGRLPKLNNVTTRNYKEK